jgi:hypothetical protein
VVFLSAGDRARVSADLVAYYADPPLAEQLAPLPTPELASRATALTSGRDDAAAAQPSWSSDAMYVHCLGRSPRSDEDSRTPAAVLRREQALKAAIAGYARSPRRELHRRGTPLPAALAAALTAELRALRWPPSSARPGVTADAYLVLSARKTAAELGTRHPHNELRRLCEELLLWYRAACDDPRYRHSAIAVTRNFVGSPHVDRFDVGPQLAVSLGEFAGGELCVEEEGGRAVAVVETRNRVAKVDGRRVHWVRTFTGGDRFSLIFYDTEEAARGAGDEN